MENHGGFAFKQAPSMVPFSSSEQFPEIMEKKGARAGMAEAKDAGGLPPAKDGGAVMPFLIR